MNLVDRGHAKAGNSEISTRVMSSEEDRVDVPLKFDEDRIIAVVTRNIYHSWRAVIQELVRNGLDSIRSKGDGVTDADYIRISINMEDCVIIVEDTGLGMSKETIVDDYSVLGRTTKSPTASLGIGSKAPFLMSDAYVVQTWKAGDEKLTIRVTRKGLRFIDETTFPPLTHHGTAVFIPFDPSKVQAESLVEQTLELVKFIPVQVFLNSDGREKMISKHDPAELLKEDEKGNNDAAGDEDGQHGTGNRTLDRISETKQWRAWCKFRTYHDSFRRSREIHLLVDWMPVSYPRVLNTYDTPIFFPFSERVVVNFSDRDMVDVAADRETLVDNEKTRNGLAVVQRETEEKWVAELLGDCNDVASIVAWGSEEERSALLSSILGHSDPEYLKRVLRWDAGTVRRIRTLFAYVISRRGTGGPIQQEEQQVTRLRDELHETIEHLRQPYYHTGAIPVRVIPCGAVLIHAEPYADNCSWSRYKRRSDKCSEDDVVDVVGMFGGVPSSELPLPTPEARAIVVNWVRYSDRHQRFIRQRRTTMIREAENVTVVPSSKELEILLGAEKAYPWKHNWGFENRTFVVQPRCHAGERILLAQKGVRGLRNSYGNTAVKRVPLTVLGEETTIGDAVNHWQHIRSRDELLFLMPNEASNFCPNEVSVDLQNIRRKNSDPQAPIVRRTRIAFIRDNADLPKAFEYLVMKLKHDYQGVDVAAFARKVMDAALSSPEARQLFKKYHGKPYSPEGYSDDIFYIGFDFTTKKSGESVKIARAKFGHILKQNTLLLCRVVRLVLHPNAEIRKGATDALASLHYHWRDGAAHFLQYVTQLVGGLERLERATKQ